MAFFYRREEIKFSDHPKFEGVKWALLVDSKKSSQASVSMLHIEPGVEIPIHTHETQIDSIYVLEGEGEAYVNGRWEKIKAGDYIFVPAKEEHGVKNTGEKALRLFIVHSPPLF
ncbi:MAG: cupin domain-containing protein [Thermodesulfobacteria bacterium]|nr:cupin domain-containing protein [Thermodesulfobacteriota bacterium]